MKITILMLLVGLSACAGPSKARYKVLLGECRVHEREYVRLDKANQARAARCYWVNLGEENYLQTWVLAQGGAMFCPRDIAEEQAMGAVGFGEGGQ